jgi:zinc protease
MKTFPKAFMRGAFVSSLILGLVTGMVASLNAAADVPGAVKGPSVEGITEYRLANGLQVLLYPDPSKPTVTVNLTMLVGSRHEGYGETGMAHLLEHMLFKGTPMHPNVPKVLQERGARFNGSTWVDRTNYFETLPAKDDNLEFAIRLEADRLVNSFVRQEDLLSEMTVVRSEFERGENMPSVLLSQRINSVAFDWHNYGKSTIGNRSDIERVPIQNLKAFYLKYYQPDNAVLIVAGKFNERDALALVEKYFGVLPKPKRKLDKTYTEEPPQDGERTVMLRRVGDVGMVGVAYHIPAGSHADVAALEVLSNVLDMPPSGRLYKALVETHKATEVSASASNYHDAGLFEVDAMVRRDSSLDDVRDILLNVTEHVGDAGITQEEVDRSKLLILKHREATAANTSAIAVQLSEWAAQGDWRLYFLHRDRIEKVTVKDVDEAANRYLTRNNRTLGMFIPTEKTDRVTIPNSPNLAKLFDGYKGREAIAAGEAFDVSPANIEARTKRSTLAEGVKIAFLPKKTRGELVRARIVLHYGTPESLKGYDTAATFLPSLMLRGTKQLSRQQILDELDKNHATLSASGDAGYASFTLETKRENLPAVLALVRQILREPSLPSDEFEVLKLGHLAGLEEQLTDPQSLAAVVLRRTINPYPKDDVRYVTTVEEEIARTKAVTLEQIKKLYQDYLSSQACEVAFVGDFDADKTRTALEDMFSGWNTKQPYARIPRLVFADVKGSQHAILTPDKANAVYVSGEVFPMKDDDADYPAALLGNYVLGGGSLSSRLGDRVRQKEGLSYHVDSHLSADSIDRRASFVISAICNPDNIKKLETTIREELDRLLKGGVTADELERAKHGYLEEQQVSRTSDGALASVLADNLYVGRTMRYYGDLERKIAAVTPEQVLSAIKKHVDPARLTIVTAGDFPGKTAAVLEKEPAGK